jgi:hypothetical protein
MDVDRLGVFDACPSVSLDHLLDRVGMPIGPPVFLTIVILLLLILNGIIALRRW